MYRDGQKKGVEMTEAFFRSLKPWAKELHEAVVACVSKGTLCYEQLTAVEGRWTKLDEWREKGDDNGLLKDLPTW